MSLRHGRLLAVIAGTAVLGAPSGSAAESSQLFHVIRPQETADWTLLSFEDGSHPIAKFKGSREVQGTLTVEWIPTEEGSEEIQALLDLTQASTESLPTLSQFVDRPWWSSKLRVQNAEAAITLSFGKEATNRFLAKDIRALKADGIFTISGYVVLGRCDHIVSFADISDAKIISPLSQDGKGEAGC